MKTQITIYCPNCGAAIKTEIVAGRSVIDCLQCGQEIILTRSNLNKYQLRSSVADEQRQFEDALANYRRRKSMGFPERRMRNSSSGSSGWNGFSDPDDFPSDGYDGGGW